MILGSVFGLHWMQKTKMKFPHLHTVYKGKTTSLSQIYLTQNADYIMVLKFGFRQL